MNPSLDTSTPLLTRRRLLRALPLGAAACAWPAWAQGPKAGTPGPTVLQVVDTSASQIDVSRDFLVGARAAWQDTNARGGLRGKAVRHLVLEVDGSASSVRSAVDALKNLTDCVAVVGTAGDRAASQLATLLRREAPDIAHVAPWLHNAGADNQDSTFGIFATRQEQIAHAVKSLSVMGVSEIGAVFGSQAEYASYRDDLEQVASGLGMRLKTYYPSNGLQALAGTLNAQSPRILIFLGGTPELVQFAQGIEKQAAQRYIVAMSDVNLQALQQLGVSRFTPVIATQAVPLVNGNQPIVRSYRETLTRLYDEPPTPQSLAGYISARYAQEVLQAVEGPLNRASALQAFARRTPMDLGGFRINPDNKRKNSAFVTQSMVAADGRLVG
ncbi:ABC transporter substrate-binding protein [Rhodoferax saidenbachensis]|uniref:ABC-type branched-subunit amino acid transport system substrate-binding protein n=1 Tax=Rhodoferax saidenbachensis TaxID=1484693 RepID=A0ABU1ZM83_9BURK|nr:ABC transporter substrate-binding protein [Rhodoferax saidenbachensis]MDR7306664.1 ABC-type branched-subunit amino acid transport system substrate-binding protein [Rhodoferax saidenbachensis]